MAVAATRQFNRLVDDASDPRVLIQDAIHAQVAATPDRVAAEFLGDGRSLTYAALAGEAAALAARLLALGAGGRDALVALQVVKSVEMAAAILGVLDAGAAYLPGQEKSASIKVAESLPPNGLRGNAFRNSYAYDPERAELHLHLKRLGTFGDVSLVLLHAVSHIKANAADLGDDSSPAFVAEFHRNFKVVTGELAKAEAAAETKAAAPSAPAAAAPATPRTAAARAAAPDHIKKTCTCLVVPVLGTGT